MSTSLRSVEAPSRRRSGVIQSGPSVSYVITRYEIACLAVRIPPAALKPTGRPVSRPKSRIASIITSEVRRAARLLDRDDLIVDALVVTGEKRAAVDDHVDLVRAGPHGLFCLGDLDRGEALPRRKRG